MDKQLWYCNVWLPLLEFYSGHVYNNDKEQTDGFMIQKKKRDEISWKVGKQNNGDRDVVIFQNR